MATATAAARNVPFPAPRRRSLRPNKNNVDDDEQSLDLADLIQSSKPRVLPPRRRDAEPRVPLALQEIFVRAQRGEEVEAPQKNLGSKLFVRCKTLFAPHNPLLQTMPPSKAKRKISFLRRFSNSTKVGMRRPETPSPTQSTTEQSETFAEEAESASIRAIMAQRRSSLLATADKSHHIIEEEQEVMSPRQFMEEAWEERGYYMYSPTSNPASHAPNGSTNTTQTQQEQQPRGRHGGKRTKRHSNSTSSRSTQTTSSTSGTLDSTNATVVARSPTALARFFTIETGYYSQPTPYQQASYGHAMTRAIRRNDVNLVRRFCDAGLSPNPCNRHGDSVVHMICRRNQLGMLRTLLRYGCHLQCTDDLGRTPLHDACWTTQPNWELITLLLQVDIHVLQAMDCYGKTPLCYVPVVAHRAWNAYLQSKLDLFWPTGHVQGPPKLTKHRPHAFPIADPSNAVPLNVAAFIANGQIAPEDASLCIHEDGAGVHGVVAGGANHDDLNHNGRHDDDSSICTDNYDDDDDDIETDSDIDYESDDSDFHREGDNFIISLHGNRNAFSAMMPSAVNV